MAELGIYGIPSRLYRFRPAGSKTEREIKALIERYIYCPPFEEMNDPMEGAHSPGLSYMIAGRFRTDSAQIRQHQKDAGIASFTEVYDYETMWAHYADQFKGFCVAYKTQSLLRELDDSHRIARMNYNDTPPVLTDDNTTAWDKAILTLCSKSVRWLHEREWRLFSKKSGPVKYRSVDAVARVYLGARIQDKDENLIRKSLAHTKINIVKMKLENYKISFTSGR
ncbi:DUF2971 domain-containing protein [Falsochrobactrum ovis]|uniref:DUF2971 family protein n=1 Tax=Falsochrobactrum ovis TaxID=1293442 RepID=A0A364JZH8_9HYPH|nr:DUF2971 domain-containing protein [Falsochrobactrum ovis]RAK34118.1 hypothetical protein C7374_101448 [Falsochrobactrum ovis]